MIKILTGQKPELEDLEHHGVKGMRWGIVKEDDTSGEESSVQKALKAHPTPKLTPEQTRKLVESQKKHDSHFDPSEADKGESKGWRPTKKEVAVVAVGAVAAAAIIYKIKTGKSAVPSGFSAEEYMNAARSTDTPGWVHEFSGTKMSPGDFRGLVDNTKGRVWTDNYATKESFLQKAYTLPKDHEFFRISQRAESSFRDTTYALDNQKDLSRYISIFKGAANADAQLISFKASKPVNVPNLHTRLEAVRKALEAEGQLDISPESVLTHYSELSGGGWDATPRARSVTAILRSQGYHAIIDDMDAGVYGESPLVLIDKTAFGPKSAKSIASLDMSQFTSALTDISNRR